jgi:hypothetical protein
LEEDEDYNCQEDLEYNGNPFGANPSTTEIDKDNEEPVEVSYPKLLSICTILVWTVTNDKKEKRKAHSIVHGMITQY